MKYCMLLGLLSAFMFAEVSCEDKMDLLRKKVESAQMLAEAGGCFPEETCRDVFLSFDLLYWHPKTDFTELGGTYERVNGSTQLDGSHTPALDFDWAFGFKTGLGYHFNEAECSLFAEYTRVAFSTSFTFNSGATRYIRSNFGNAVPSDFVVSMKGSHKIDYQTVKLELGRQLRLGSYFSLKPAFGVKTSWINQLPHIINFQINPSPDADEHVEISEKTIGLGPQTTLYTNWSLCNGWSVYADSGIALLFTRYRGRVSERGSSGNTEENASDKEDKHYVSPNLMLALGISYAHFMAGEKQHVRVALGYESQYYVNQSYFMQNRRIEQVAEARGGWFGRNLSVYGLTLSGAYQF